MFAIARGRAEAVDTDSDTAFEELESSKPNLQTTKAKLNRIITNAERERRERANENYDSEDEEAEARIERVVGKEVARLIVKEGNLNRERAEWDEEWDEEYQAQWGDAYDAAYAEELDKLEEAWENDPESEEMYFDYEFDAVFEKRMDWWSSDWGPEMREYPS